MCVVRAPARKNTPHSSIEDVSRPRTGQPSAGTDHSTPVSVSTKHHKPVIHKPQSPDKKQKKNKKRRGEEGKDV